MTHSSTRAREHYKKIVLDRGSRRSGKAAPVDYVNVHHWLHWLSCALCSSALAAPSYCARLAWQFCSCVIQELIQMLLIATLLASVAAVSHWWTIIITRYCVPCATYLMIKFVRKSNRAAVGIDSSADKFVCCILTDHIILLSVTCFCSNAWVRVQWVYYTLGIVSICRTLPRFTMNPLSPSP